MLEWAINNIGFVAFVLLMVLSIVWAILEKLGVGLLTTEQREWLKDKLQKASNTYTKNKIK